MDVAVSVQKYLYHVECTGELFGRYAVPVNIPLVKRLSESVAVLSALGRRRLFVVACV